MDSSGNVLVTGQFKSSTGTFSGTNGTSGTLANTNWSTSEAFVWKLDSAGRHLWVAGGGGSDNDYGKGIAVDGAGNVLVTGCFASSSATFRGISGSGSRTNQGSAGWMDAFVWKLDSAGRHLWVAQAGGSGSNDDIGYKIAVDGAGNVLVTGSFRSAPITFMGTSGFGSLTTGGLEDAFVWKLDSSGCHLWVAQAGGSGSGSGSEYGYGIAADYAGNVLVTGSFASSSATFTAPTGSWTLNNQGINYSRDAFVWKINPDQNPHLLANPTTPLLPQLVSGSDPAGVLALDARNLFSAALLTRAAAQNAGGLIVRVDSPPFGTNYSAYDLFLLANLSDQPWYSPKLGVGTTQVPMQYDDRPLLQLNPYRVYATLIRETDTAFQMEVSLPGLTSQLITGTIANGEAVFLKNALLVPLTISDPDGSITDITAAASDPTVLVEVRGNQLAIIPPPNGQFASNPEIAVHAQEPTGVMPGFGGRSDEERFYVGIGLSMISGKVVNAQDGKGIEGATLFIDRDDSGTLDPATEPFTVTDSSGFYHFVGLGTGTYKVTLLPPGSWNITTATVQTVTVAVGEIKTGVNFSGSKVLALAQTSPAGGVPLVEGTPITVTASFPSGGSYTVTWEVLGGPTTNLQANGTTFTFTPTDNGSYTVKATATGTSRPSSFD